MQHQKVAITNHQQKTGFTLIELLIYLGIVSVFLVAAIRIVWDVVYTRERSGYQQVVHDELRTLSAVITKVVEEAWQIQSSGNGLLLTQNNDGTVELSLSQGTVFLTENGITFPLSSNQVTVNQMLFDQLSSTNHQAISFSIIAQPTVPQQSKYQSISQSFTKTVSLKANYLEARNLLIVHSHLIAEVVENQTRLTNLTLYNSSQSSITLDKIRVSWLYNPQAVTLNSIRIADGQVEWVGEAGSGELIDLDPLIIPPTSSILINFLEFNQLFDQMELEIEFIMSDNTNRKTKIAVSVNQDPNPSPTPTPPLQATPTPPAEATPTPTLAPINACADYCLSQGYLGGICRQNANRCRQNNEVYSSPGSQYCTQSPNINCCCQ